ncbi:hypothetical protein [Tersicoccus sp. Bi-70]|uniref:hypothetical protein n=1 Tax=Tersicoccus sp. Bi-70 TaxID=1897634 RepID=UPI00118108DD|nr:hypothetical protein [Tersicoccus sp. Bi-70]
MPNYASTYRHFLSRAILWSQVATHLILPLFVFALALYANLQLRFVSQVTAGIAILAGFLFTLLVFIFQLRADVGQSTTMGVNVALKRLIDELFVTVGHAIIVSVTLVGWLMYLSTTMQNEGDPLPAAVSALICLATSHLIALLWTITKRTRVAYGELLH